MANGMTGAEYGFSTVTKLPHGRSGRINTPHGSVATPAFFPVVNYIGGPTVNSGGIWSRVRNTLFGDPRFQGALYQAMGFTDFDVPSETMDDHWRTQSMHDHYPEFEQPLFVDSGGFKLVNSETFGSAPEEGGDPNEYGIYTNPESILSLQRDYGADIIATLDYPIPPNLKEDEQTERMEQSIQSAIRCLELLEEWGWDVTVYVAIHGHDYETINWYVSQVLDEAGQRADRIAGFAIGSLVPLREKVDVLVDIVQGATDAIPDGRREEFGLHVFGVSGRVCPLLSLLGVDSFDSSAYIQTSRYKKVIHPETWQRFAISEVDDPSWLIGEAFDTDYDEMLSVLNADTSYKEIDGWMKSDFYAMLAHHNFLVYNREVERTRDAIAKEALLEYVVSVADTTAEVAKGLKRAQLRDDDLMHRLETAGVDRHVAGAEVTTQQTTISRYGDDDYVAPAGSDSRTISLNHSAEDFDVRQRGYSVPADKQVLLVIPCSQRKPYRESRTQQAVLSTVADHESAIEKVTVSGLYGPVPATFEEEPPVLEYEYVLTTTDKSQMELVTGRLVEFLEDYAPAVDLVVGYAASRAYREVIAAAFDRAVVGELYPANPAQRKLTEHFRRTNLDELADRLDAFAPAGHGPADDD
jgi:tRNA-guanine family transglycosylase